jgi:light-regulated signal transduction histidine kinase (bacteriophytochrome)
VPLITQNRDDLVVLKHHVAALEQLFEVYEGTALEQASRLELLLEERRRAERELQQHKLHLEELVAERTAALQRANEQLKVDIAARKQAEHELAKKAQELARSNADLEKFAYVASHDLQEPLRMVASYTQLLAKRYKGKLDTDADEFIDFAVDGANRMRQLIQELLSYSRVGTRGKPLQPVDIQVACANAIKNLLHAIEESCAKVSVDSLPTVMGDATQLAQLFQNLIGNGIKYRDSRPPEIQVKATQEGDMWLFSVHDNGIGIDAQYFDRIFEMFQRLHTRKEYSGTGMGLAICRKIVQRHGGEIWVESRPGNGSTFFFTIPHIERSVNEC